MLLRGLPKQAWLPCHGPVLFIWSSTTRRWDTALRTVEAAGSTVNLGSHTSRMKVMMSSGCMSEVSEGFSPLMCSSGTPLIPW